MSTTPLHRFLTCSHTSYLPSHFVRTLWRGLFICSWSKKEKLVPVREHPVEGLERDAGKEAPLFVFLWIHPNPLISREGLEYISFQIVLSADAKITILASDFQNLREFTTCCDRFEVICMTNALPRFSTLLIPTCSQHISRQWK